MSRLHVAIVGDVGYVVLRPQHSLKTMALVSVWRFQPDLSAQRQTPEGCFLPGGVLTSLAPGMHVPQAVGAGHVQYYKEGL